VNAAARLEAANKQFGSSIGVRLAAAARRDAGIFRPLGTIVVRGRDEPMAVFESWPSDAPPGWRRRYLVAVEPADRDPVGAAALFEQLALERRDDMVVRRMAEELNAATDHAA
jgi:adenylate cyclase